MANQPLADLLGARAAELLEGVLVASIGPITTATAEQRGLAVGLTAMESTVGSLLSGLEAHFAKGDEVPEQFVARVAQK